MPQTLVIILQHYNFTDKSKRQFLYYLRNMFIFYTYIPIKRNSELLFKIFGVYIIF